MDARRAVFLTTGHSERTQRGTSICTPAHKNGSQATLLSFHPHHGPRRLRMLYDVSNIRLHRQVVCFKSQAQNLLPLPFPTHINCLPSPPAFPLCHFFFKKNSRPSALVQISVPNCRQHFLMHNGYYEATSHSHHNEIGAAEPVIVAQSQPLSYFSIS